MNANSILGTTAHKKCHHKENLKSELVEQIFTNLGEAFEGGGGGRAGGVNTALRKFLNNP
jgi:hypothetical protein